MPLSNLKSSSDIRFRAATLALVTTVVLTALKLGAGFMTGSVGVYSEGIHSSLDMVSALVAFFTIRESIKPADEDHPFGHGKIETLSSLFEAVLLVLAALYIFYEAVDSFLNPRPVVEAWIGIVVISISLVVSYAVYLQNRKAAVATDSRAIEVNALHFLADAVTSLGVLVALIIIRFTHLPWVDPLMAFLIGVYILSISWGQIRGSIRELVDRRLPGSEVEVIESVLKSYYPRALGIHELRTRKSGVNRHIEFHLSMCGKWSVHDSHALCDEIEDGIIRFFPGAHVAIHVEPCGNHDWEVLKACVKSPDGLCEYRKKKEDV